jgi:hypothetical protein
MPDFPIGRLSALNSSSRSLPVSPSNGSSSGRVERGPVLTIVIVFIGLPLIAGWIFSYTIKSFPSPFPSSAWYGSKGALFIEFTPNFADQISKAAPDAIFGKFLIALMYLMPKGAIGVLDFIGVRLRRVAVAKRQN